MNQNGNKNMYEGLASYFLPEGVLKYFEVTDFATQRTLDKDVLYTTELHIYLDERDNRTPDMKDSVSNGFGEESWRTRQTLWRAVQMLTQKLCCQTIHDCPKVVPLHYESE